MLPPDEHTLPSSDVADVLAGTAYRTIGVLGQGGMGQVLDAEHTALARRVVVKVVRGDTTVPQGEDRLRLEAQALARTDVYAMGVVPFHLLVGHGPFPRAKDAVQAAMAHVRERPEPPSAFTKQPIPSALDAVVLRALAKRPEERFVTAADMEAALAPAALSSRVAAAPSPVAPSPVAPRGTGEQDTSRHSMSPETLFVPSMMVLAGAVLCSAVTTLALLWWLR